MIKAVLFDVDGVLIDSFEGNRRTYSYVAERFGGNPISMPEYKKLYHLASRGLFMQIFPRKSEKEIEKIIEFKVKVSPDFFKYDQSMPHIKGVLDNLKKNLKLGVVTNRVKPDLAILDFFSLRRFFDAEVSYSDVKNHKPHPEGINLALKKLGVKPEEALYVGDAATDLEAGKAAGVKVIIYRNPEVKGNFNIKDLREISKIIEMLNKAG